MIRKIVVGIDRSKLGHQVLQKAIAIAAAQAAQLKLVHVLGDHEPDAPRLGAYTVNSPSVELNLTLLKTFQTDWNQHVQDQQQWLDRQTELAGEGGVQASSHLVIGRPGPELSDVAQRWQADLIIVGSHGHTGLNELVIGSVSNYLLHRAPCSVMVVNGADTAQAIDRILVPVDKSDIAAKIVAQAALFGKPHGADLRLLHVIDGDEPGVPEKPIFADSQYMLEHGRLLAQEYRQEWNHFISGWWQWLQAQVQKVEATGLTCISDLRQGRTGPQICSLANEWQADLIVIGCRGFQGLHQLLMGSVCHYVSHRAGCSVLVIRPGSRPASDAVEQTTQQTLIHS